MQAPVKYIPSFVEPSFADDTSRLLWNQLDWIRHDKVPRREYYIGNEPYAYGVGAGRRVYWPQPIHPRIDQIWKSVELHLGVKFDVCFLNGYEDQSDSLGWHADDSPEMDDTRPIAIVSLGAVREVWFRPAPSPIKRIEGDSPAGELVVLTAGGAERLPLQHGSLCVMAPGMQDTHQHRIPKAGRVVGKRISFTFRGFVKP